MTMSTVTFHENIFFMRQIFLLILSRVISYCSTWNVCHNLRPRKRISADFLRSQWALEPQRTDFETNPG